MGIVPKNEKTSRPEERAMRKTCPPEFVSTLLLPLSPNTFVINVPITKVNRVPKMTVYRNIGIICAITTENINPNTTEITITGRILLI
jgi:hypothetical protein